MPFQFEFKWDLDWISCLIIYYNFYLIHEWYVYMIWDIIKNNLNEFQAEAANWISTSSLILAWAWSWKTRVLTYKIANLIFDKWIRPSEILAVTFTNKAANEMKQRLVEIANQVNSSNLPNSSVDFDELTSSYSNTNSTLNISNKSFNRVWTFHSVFLKILKIEIEWLDIWYNKDFWIYDVNETLSLIKSVIDWLKLKDKIDAKEAKWKISALKNEWITPDKFPYIANWEWDEMMCKIYDNYQKELIKSNSMDFDDLLLYTKILFEKNTDILNKYVKKFKYILVDEAQDTNQIQFDIIRQIWWAWNVTFIWDDFQSIYWRRWAVMENFLNLNKRWPDLKIFKLEINYRSKDHIVQAWNAIISKNESQYYKNVKSHRWWDDKIRVFWFRDEYDEATSIVSLISRMVNEKKLNWSDFAILYRTNSQSQPFEQIFLQEWIPYKVWWWFKFFERKEIKDIISYIKYIINPRDNIALKRIINTPSRKIWKVTIDKIESFAIDNWFDMNYVVSNIDTLPINVNSWASNTIKSFATTMKFLMSHMETLYPSDFIKNLISSIKYKDYLVTSEWKEKAEEKIENIWQLINMATKYNKDTHSIPIDAMKQFLEEISILVDLEDWEETPNAVKLMSIHSSKWLEFQVVFVVWLEENMFPLSKAKFEKKEMEEERRLMYVAITRAEDLLFFSYADTRMKRWQISYNKQSRFIDEIPDYLLKYYNIQWEATTKSIDYDEWDRVYHKLFWSWVIVEIWNNMAVVRFDNEKFNIRKMEVKFLTKE